MFPLLIQLLTPLTFEILVILGFDTIKGYNNTFQQSVYKYIYTIS